MKKYYAISVILILGLVLGACGTTDNQETTEAPEQTNQQDSEPTSGSVESSEESSGENSTGDSGEDVNLESGLKTVITSVEQLRASLEESDETTDVETINEKGKALEENWDSIEKNVEEKYPDQYKKIEESLYPLIAEAKKEKPDIDKMKELAESTMDSLKALKQTVEHSN